MQTLMKSVHDKWIKQTRYYKGSVNSYFQKLKFGLEQVEKSVECKHPKLIFANRYGNFIATICRLLAF